jgi:hypothetical protein
VCKKNPSREKKHTETVIYKQKKKKKQEIKTIKTEQGPARAARS